MTDATALAAAIRDGRTTALAVMEAALDRLAERQDLGAVRSFSADTGLAAAKAHDALLRSGSRRAHTPFGGVPFLMKDLGNAAAGFPPVGGSGAVLARSLDIAKDSMLAARFRRSGLLPFGLTTTSEFGLALTSEPPTGPVARNPWSVAHSPGGSSGGAAAAVAAGIVAIAHATDAAGSIRMPAACCSVVGLKPTRGTTPNGPDFRNHLMGITGELVVARSIRDVAQALARCSGHAAGPFCDPVPDLFDLDVPLRIGVVTDAPGIAPIGGPQATAVENCARILGEAGHALVPVKSAVLAALSERSLRSVGVILSVALAAWLDALGVAETEVSPLAAAVATKGRSTPATALFVADHEATLIAHALWQTFESVDVILTPMLAGQPPRIGAFAMDHRDVEAHLAKIGAMAPYAALANAGGLPALCIPHGLDSDGLPIGVHLLAPMGGDQMVLHVGAILEREAPWTYPWPIAGMPA